MSQVMSQLDQERRELEWLLTSGVLGRSHNLTQVLKFICEKHFQGHPEEISEHSVAVEALGRRSDFDPQLDTIVRVTTHTLRKRLQEIYQGEGAAHPIHIEIPPGQYAPLFLRIGEVGSEASQPETGESAGEGKRSIIFRKWWPIAAAAVLAGILATAYFLSTHHRAIAPAPPPTSEKAASITGQPVRALLGDGRKPYVDHSGFTWSPGNFCHGGSCRLRDRPGGCRHE